MEVQITSTKGKIKAVRKAIGIAKEIGMPIKKMRISVREGTSNKKYVTITMILGVFLLVVWII